MLARIRLREASSQTRARGCTGSGGEAGEVGVVFAEALVGGLFGAAVDFDEDLARREVGVADHEQGVALEGGRAFQRDIRAGDRRRPPWTGCCRWRNRRSRCEGADFDDVQAFGKVRGGECQRTVRGVDLVRVVEAARDVAAAGVEEVMTGSWTPLPHLSMTLSTAMPAGTPRRTCRS